MHAKFTSLKADQARKQIWMVMALISWIESFLRLTSSTQEHASNLNVKLCPMEIEI